MINVEWTYELRFAVALALGFLVGLERESASADRKLNYFAGVRTYTLVSLYGFGCAWLHHMNITMALPIGMISISALSVAGYIGKLKEGRVGSTSEVAVLMTFLVGMLAVVADIWVPMSLAIISTILLSEKAGLENFVDKLERSEFLAVLKFLLVTVIILPVLPNHEYTRFNLNPTRVWQVVIQVSSIGFIGYFLTKKLGSKLGLLLSGLIGGLASSTAVTINTARIAGKAPERSANALQASILASSVMYLRTLILVWFINAEFVAVLWWKLLLLSGIGMALSLGITSRHDIEDGAPETTLQNPFELRPAIYFGTIFVGLSVITMLVREYFGDVGLLAVSFVAGINDVTSITLSLVQHTVTVERVVVSAIILAAMTNTVVKGIYFAMISKQLQKQTAIRFGIWALLHLPLVVFF